MTENNSPSDDSITRAKKLLFEFLSESHENREADFDSLCEEHSEDCDELKRLYQNAQTATNRHAFLESLDSEAEDSLTLEPDSSDTSMSDVVERLEKTTPEESRYELRGEIARGGMGAIIKVWDKTLRRTLAMKVALGKEDASKPGSTSAVDDRTLGRFLDEAQITGQLDHPGILPVYELGVDHEGQVYFTMRLVKGRTLSDIFELVKEGKEGWTQTRALGVILKVCEAMAYAHSKKVIHRDLKPANIMVGRFGEAYVMDWGLAKVLGTEDKKDIRIKSPDASSLSIHTDLRDTPADSPLMTMDGDVVGTPAYMSPEQARGDLDAMGPASDVYAMGAILYQLLAGHMPYAPPGKRVNAVLIWSSVQDGPPKRLKSIDADTPAELEAICEKAMAREIGGRYVTTQEMAEDLRAFMEGRVVRAYESGRAAAARKWVRRNSALTGSMAAAIVLLVAGLLASLYLYSQSERNRLAAERETERANLEASEGLIARDSALWQSYVANIRAARLAIDSGATNDARKYLDLCPAELRNWEWHYLGARCDDSTRTFVGHTSTVHDVAFDADSLRLLSGSNDGTARMWDIATGEEIVRFKGHEGAVRDVQFGAQGRVLLASEDGKIRSWDTHTALPLRDLQTRALQFDHPSIAVSPSGLLATGGWGHDLRIWDQDEETVLGSASLGDDWIASLAFNSDGSLVAAGLVRSGVRVWETSTLNQVASARITFPPGPVNSIAFASDNRLLFGTESGLVCAWNFSEFARPDRVTLPDPSLAGKLDTEVIGNWDPVKAVAISPVDGHIAVASKDGSIRLLDGTNLAELDVLEGHEASVESVAFDATGQWLASGSEDKTIRLWNMSSRELVVQLEEPAKSPMLSKLDEELSEVSFSPDGNRVASMGLSRVSVWNAKNGRLIWSSNPSASDELLTTFALGCNGEYVSVGTSRGRVLLLDGRSGNTVKEWTHPSPSQEAGLGLTEGIVSIDFHPSERLIAAASRNGVQVWHIDSGNAERYFDASTALEAILSPGTRKQRRLLDYWGPDLSSIAFSPDGRSLVVGGINGILEWSLATGLPPDHMGENGRFCTTLALDPMGTTIAAGSSSGEISLWNRDAIGPRLILEGHRGRTTSLCFSPDGSRLFSSAEDRRLRVWDTKSGDALLDLDVPGSLDVDTAGERIAAAAAMTLIVFANSESAREYRSSQTHAEGIDSLVHSLYREHLLPDDVASAIDGQEGLSPSDRAEAAERARELLGEHVQEMNSTAWRIVDPDGTEGGDLDRALRLARTAVDLDPRSGGIRDTLAWALFANGRHEEALVESRKAVQLASDMLDGEPEPGARNQELVEACKRNLERMTRIVAERTGGDD
jgi:WD40 repeat protein/serine/threonine protein kinase